MMGSNETIATVVSTSVSLMALWVFFFWLYRDYRRDLFRQRLFQLRDELFDLGRSGGIDFNDPAYGILRSVINGTIRFGHRLGFLDVVMFSALTRTGDLRRRATSFEERWSSAVSKLDPAVQKVLRLARGKLHYIVLDQIVFTSSVLMLTFVPALAWSILRRVHGLVARSVRAVLGDGVVNSFGTQLDWAAHVMGSNGSAG